MPKGDARARVLPAKQEHLRVEWRKRESYETTWVHKKKRTKGGNAAPPVRREGECSTTQRWVDEGRTTQMGEKGEKGKGAALEGREEEGKTTQKEKETAAPRRGEGGGQDHQKEEEVTTTPPQGRGESRGGAATTLFTSPYLTLLYGAVLYFF